MPTQQHDMLAELFRSTPEIAAEAMAALGVPVPPYEKAMAASESFTDLKTSEYTGDAVVLLDGADQKLGVVIEVQRQKDEEKRWTWPLYLHTFRVRERCPAVLLVIAPDSATAQWCATPIESGHPGHVLVPLVLDAAHVRMITTGGEFAADPDRAVLSAFLHCSGPHREKVLRAVLDGLAELRTTSFEKTRRYAGYVLGVLPETARKILENMMITDERPYVSELFQSLEAKGKAEGKAEAVLRLLGFRGIEVPEEVKERILACRDIEQLDVWLERAFRADSGEAFTL